MRIGVLTLPLHTNYGGILQAYALQRVLQDMGHDVVLLDSYPQCPKMFPFLVQLAFYIKRFAFKVFLRRKTITVFYEKQQIRQYPLKEHIRQFYRRNIRHEDFDYINPKISQDFDALIVGSDQVWRPMYSPDIFNAYLSFAKDWVNVKRIAYATSFGTAEWEYSKEQPAECYRLVQMFDAVSVREESGVTLCKEHFSIDASWVLDPTLLVDTRHYMEHIAKVDADYPLPMCFGYILDASEEKNAILYRIATTQGFQMSSFQNVDDPDNSAAPSVESWLKAFHDAEYVFTDSFHGCVFSILFNKPFVVYGNKERGMARFHSLLSMFGLEDRLATTPDEAARVASLSIDWIRVNNRLSELRKVSKEFLFALLNTTH